MMILRQRLQLFLLTVSLVGFVGLAGCSDDTDPDGQTDAAIENDGGGDDADSGPDEGDAADTDTTPDPDDAGDIEPDPDPDTTPDPDTGDAGTDPEPDVDICGDGDDDDTDGDGLLDCEEKQIGTDEDNHDTDGDNLSDTQELLNGSDPLTVDTDGDGVSDGDEVDLGLDPTQTDTYGDGTSDDERWIVTACDTPEPESVDFHRSELLQTGPTTEVDVGNWRIALPTTFGNYTQLTIDGASLANRQAAAAYDDPSLEIAGFLLSDVPDGSSEQTVDQVMAHHMSDLESVSSIERDWVPSAFTSHDFRPAKRGDFEISTSSPQSAKQVRDNLLFALAPFSSNQAGGLPTATGATYTRFRVYVSTVYRTFDNDKQVMTSVAVAPEDKFVTRDKVRFRMDDLTNTTFLAESGDAKQVRCDVSPPREAPPTDFYWVLDHSGSMSDENTQVANMANQFFNELDNTALDYRLGVTSMEPSNNGRLRPNAGWHTDLQTFIGEVNWVINLNGGTEPGIEMAHNGIEYMKGLAGTTPPANERIRADASIIVIWMSDEEDQYFKSNSLSTAAGQQMMMDRVSFFNQNNTTSFAIVGDGNGCGEDGIAYRAAAQATGGSNSLLCSSNMETTIEEIIVAATSEVGYPLPDTPISSSLRVWLNGEWVPRSRENGFDYFSNNDTIAFFGSYRPEKAAAGEEPDTIAVHYETWLDMTKD